MPKLNRRDSESAPTPATLRVGIIGGAHGLRGGLRVRLDSPESTALRAAGRVFFELNGVARDHETRKAARINSTTVKLEVEGVNTPEEANALRGAIVLVDANELPALRSGEFYYHQAIGCEVITVAGERVGTIEEIFATGANDVWVVRDGRREVLVPVIEDVVKTVDLTARRMTIEPLPGLLDP